MTRPIEQLVEPAERGRLNNTARKLGVRPIGEVRERLFKILADLALFQGESPERAEELLQEARKEQQLDDKADLIQVKINKASDS